MKSENGVVSGRLARGRSRRDTWVRSRNVGRGQRQAAPVRAWKGRADTVVHGFIILIAEGALPAGLHSMIAQSIQQKARHEPVRYKDDFTMIAQSFKSFCYQSSVV